MAVPVVSTCCFRVNLHNGSLVIGFISITACILELFLLCMSITFRPGELSLVRLGIYTAYASADSLHLLFGVLMIVGIIRHSACLTLPWTMWSGIMCVSHVVAGSLALMYMVLGEEQLHVDELILVSYCLVKPAAYLYFIMVVHSRHKEIMELAPSGVEQRTFLRRQSTLRKQ